MAILRFGNFEVQAEMPELDPIPKIGPTPFEHPSVVSSVDVQELIRQAVAALPKVEIPEPQNFDPKPLYDVLDGYENRLSALENKPEIVIPEVKNITNVKDVSPEVLRQCEKMVRLVEAGLVHRTNELSKDLEVQRKINWFLFGSILLTSFLHLLGVM